MFLEIFCSVVLFAVLFLLVAIPYWHWREVNFLSKYYLKNVPGPKPNPYFGNLLLVFNQPVDQFLKVFSDLFDQYGTIVNVFGGPIKSNILVADAKLFQEILSSNELIDKPVSYKNLESWLGTGLLTSTGLKWKKRRRIITPAFHFSILENFVDVFEKNGEVFIKKLETYSENESFDLYPLVSLLTLDIICETAMGIPVNAQINEDSIYPKTVKKMCEAMLAKNISPIVAICPLLYPLTPNYYKERNALKILHSHTEAVIDKKIKDLRTSKVEEIENNFGKKRRVAFLDLLLNSIVDGQCLSKNDIKEEVDTFMFEGHDTISSAISFALYALANHPLVQEKALEEQISIFGNLEKAKPLMTQLNEMKYLELIIKETLRLYPPVTIFARTVSEDYKWGNITLPKGQQVTMFPYVAHRNPEYFPEPLRFYPERFESIDGTNPYTFIPFSAGPRNCIGQRFAMLELKSTISKVLRNFELIPDKTHELKLAPELILVSKSGVRISLRKR